MPHPFRTAGRGLPALPAARKHECLDFMLHWSGLGFPVGATQNGPPGGGPFAGGCVPGDYFLDFFAGAAGAVAAGSWVLGWIASITGVAMKTEA